MAQHQAEEPKTLITQLRERAQGHTALYAAYAPFRRDHGQELEAQVDEPPDKDNAGRPWLAICIGVGIGTVIGFGLACGLVISVFSGANSSSQQQEFSSRGLFFLWLALLC